jgi:hypothetical protein
MAVGTRELYRGSDGARWLLGREPATGDVFAWREPNAPSRGQLTHIDVGAFLSRGREIPSTAPSCI